MKTFIQILRECYGTDDDQHYIVPRLSDNDLNRCVQAYAHQCCVATLEKAADDNRYVTWHTSANLKKIITNPLNIVIL